MTTNASDWRRTFVLRYLPWLVAVAALAVYWMTLNRWVSLFNLRYVAQISGWTWQPQVAGPVTFLVTYPFRWLHTPEIPLALNLFSAVCAALTLGLLARSVALLPHDRTGAQREREHSDHALLSIGQAWLPPVFAAVVCGMQLTFWEQATNCAGEMLDLLLFAFVIWSLLEYRLDERPARLLLAAFVYGAGMTNNWAMMGFFPVFIAAIIWIRGFSFFNLRFLVHMALCGLAGMSLYLLLPASVVISGQVPGSFWWGALKANPGQQLGMIKLFLARPDLRQHVELMSLTSLLPVFVLAIRWKSSFGDTSKLGAALASFMFHLAHIIILAVCVWVAFDPPFSPRHLGFSLPFLTFYYLGALGVGYYSGYFLLVFRKIGTRLQMPQGRPAPILNFLSATGVWGLFVAATMGLAYKNLPQIRATNDNTLQRYTSLVEEKLPRAGGFLLGDPDSPGFPSRLYLVQAALARDGRLKDFVPLDTQSLSWPPYHRYLHKKYPQKWPNIIRAEEVNELNPRGIVAILSLLARTNDLYYLHPSYGYYFEQFYLEPHGLIYKLKTLPDDTMVPPLPDKNQIAENEAFWSQAEARTLAPIIRLLTPPDPNAPKSLGERLLGRFHVPRELNQNAVTAGAYYSRSLNFWGVELQRAGELTKAANEFDAALKLNPDNVVAQLNLSVNESLRAGRPVPVDLSKATPDQFGAQYHTWNEVLAMNGPFDDPSFCLANGLMLVQIGLMRQAVEPLLRVRELAPDNLPARLWLAELYVLARQPDRALETLHDVSAQPERFSLNAAGEVQLKVMQAAAYFQKNDARRATDLLEAEITRQPNDPDLLNMATRFYMTYGLFANALHVINHQLQLATNDATALLNKGYVCLQLDSYDEAINALTRLLAMQSNNVDARFNRALAYLRSDKLDAARQDYEILLPSMPQSFQVAYGLGEISRRKHETNSAIKYYELYLANANTNTDEASNIVQRLHELKGKSR